MDVVAETAELDRRLTQVEADEYHRDPLTQRDYALFLVAGVVVPTVATLIGWVV